MGQRKSSDGFCAGQRLPAIIACIIAGVFITISAGCAGRADQGRTVNVESTGTDAVPDASRLQLPAVRFADLMPADPQPADDALRPGLSAVYYFDYFARHLDPLTSGSVPPDTGVTGKPIPFLNHRFGRQEVFDSGTNRGVAIRMRGLIRFPTPGEYTFRALSNDGLRVRVADAMVIDDPTQHSDRYAIQAVVTIGQAGWYPLQVEYFQRKGTAAIELWWRTPEAGDFEPVPASSFAHLP
ncbi:MAG: hypothetical protein AMJ54_04080 [Deltaproteobacteria bacterium SG8_13]|nr:MAG: hypothetical protein AMJ54_04080 [Deltaproteobacteria bacterium SG8_13]